MPGEISNPVFVPPFSGAVASWASVTGKPEAFPPSSHGHSRADVEGLAPLELVAEPVNGEAGELIIQNVPEVGLSPAAPILIMAPSGEAQGLTRWQATAYGGVWIMKATAGNEWLLTFDSVDVAFVALEGDTPAGLSWPLGITVSEPTPADAIGQFAHLPGSPDRWWIAETLTSWREVFAPDGLSGEGPPQGITQTVGFSLFAGGMTTAGTLRFTLTSDAMEPVVIDVPVEIGDDNYIWGPALVAASTGLTGPYAIIYSDSGGDISLSVVRDGATSVRDASLSLSVVAVGGAVMGYPGIALVLSEPIELWSPAVLASYAGQLYRDTAPDPDAWYRWDGSAWAEDAVTQAAIEAALIDKPAFRAALEVVRTVALIQSDYDDLETAGTVDPATNYIITDAPEPMPAPLELVAEPVEENEGGALISGPLISGDEVPIEFPPLPRVADMNGRMRHLVTTGLGSYDLAWAAAGFEGSPPARWELRYTDGFGTNLWTSYEDVSSPDGLAFAPEGPNSGFPIVSVSTASEATTAEQIGQFAQLPGSPDRWWIAETLTSWREVFIGDELDAAAIATALGYTPADAADIPTTPGEVGAAESSHTHAQIEVINLETDLAGKAALDGSNISDKPAFRAALKVPGSDPALIPGGVATAVANMVFISQVNYDGLITPAANTLYIIV